MTNLRDFDELGIESTIYDASTLGGGGGGMSVARSHMSVYSSNKSVIGRGSGISLAPSTYSNVLTHQSIMHSVPGDVDDKSMGTHRSRRTMTPSQMTVGASRVVDGGRGALLLMLTSKGNPTCALAVVIPNCRNWREEAVGMEARKKKLVVKIEESKALLHSALANAAIAKTALEEVRERCEAARENKKNKKRKKPLPPELKEELEVAEAFEAEKLDSVDHNRATYDSAMAELADIGGSREEDEEEGDRAEDAGAVGADKVAAEATGGVSAAVGAVTGKEQELGGFLKTTTKGKKPSVKSDGKRRGNLAMFDLDEIDAMIQRSLRVLHFLWDAVGDHTLLDLLEPPRSARLTGEPIDTPPPLAASEVTVGEKSSPSFPKKSSCLQALLVLVLHGAFTAMIRELLHVLSRPDMPGGTAAIVMAGGSAPMIKLLAHTVAEAETISADAHRADRSLLSAMTENVEIMSAMASCDRNALSANPKALQLYPAIPYLSHMIDLDLHDDDAISLNTAVFAALSALGLHSTEGRLQVCEQGAMPLLVKFVIKDGDPTLDREERSAEIKMKERNLRRTADKALLHLLFARPDVIDPRILCDDPQIVELQKKAMADAAAAKSAAKAAAAAAAEKHADEATQEGAGADTDATATKDDEVDYAAAAMKAKMEEVAKAKALAKGKAYLPTSTLVEGLESNFDNGRRRMGRLVAMLTTETENAVALGAQVVPSLTNSVARWRSVLDGVEEKERISAEREEAAAAAARHASLLSSRSSNAGYKPASQREVVGREQDDVENLADAREDGDDDVFEHEYGEDADFDEFEGALKQDDITEVSELGEIMYALQSLSQLCRYGDTATAVAVGSDTLVEMLVEMLFEGARDSGDELELQVCTITELSWDFGPMPGEDLPLELRVLRAEAVNLLTALAHIPETAPRVARHSGLALRMVARAYGGCAPALREGVPNPRARRSTSKIVPGAGQRVKPQHAAWRALLIMGGDDDEEEEEEKTNEGAGGLVVSQHKKISSRLLLALLQLIEKLATVPGGREGLFLSAASCMGLASGDDDEDDSSSVATGANRSQHSRKKRDISEELVAAGIMPPRFVAPPTDALIGDLISNKNTDGSPFGFFSPIALVLMGVVGALCGGTQDVEQLQSALRSLKVLCRDSSTPAPPPELYGTEEGQESGGGSRQASPQKPHGSRQPRRACSSDQDKYANNDGNQPLLADIFSAVAVRLGSLVGLILLPQTIPVVSGAWGVLNEAFDLSFYLISRGTSRDHFWSSLPPLASDPATVEPDNGLSSKGVTSQSSGDPDPNSSSSSCAVKSLRSVLDPNRGPSKAQWGSLLNALAWIEPRDVKPPHELSSALTAAKAAAKGLLLSPGKQKNSIQQRKEECAVAVRAAETEVAVALETARNRLAPEKGSPESLSPDAPGAYWSPLLAAVGAMPTWSPLRLNLDANPNFDFPAENVRGGSIEIVLHLHKVLQPPRNHHHGNGSRGESNEALYSIDVRVLSADDLPNTDPLDKSDPFVQIRIGNHSFASSQTVQNSLSPVFNETLSFVVGVSEALDGYGPGSGGSGEEDGLANNPEGGALHHHGARIEIWDYDYSSPTLMCSTPLPLVFPGVNDQVRDELSPKSQAPDELQDGVSMEVSLPSSVTGAVDLSEEAKAAQKSRDVVNALVVGGADPETCDAQQRTAVMHALALGNDSAVTVLIKEAGASLNARDINGHTVLQYAFAAPTAAAAKHALHELLPEDQGGNDDDDDDDGGVAGILTKGGMGPSRLTSSATKLSARRGGQMTAASDVASEVTMSEMGSPKAAIRGRDGNRQRRYHRGSNNGQGKESSSGSSKDRSSALTLRGDLRLVPLVLSSGADPNEAEDQRGDFGLHMALRGTAIDFQLPIGPRGKPRLLRLRTRPPALVLMQSSASAAATSSAASFNDDEQQLSPTSLATLAKKEAAGWELASLLALRSCLRRQAAPDLCNHAGETALHVLVEEGTLGADAMKWLLDAGANPNLLNVAGEIPAHGFARRVNRDAPAMLEMLLEAGRGRSFRCAVFGNAKRALSNAAKQSLDVDVLFDDLRADLVCPMSVAKETATVLDVLAVRAPSVRAPKIPPLVNDEETPTTDVVTTVSVDLPPLPLTATAAASEATEAAEAAAKASGYEGDSRWPLLHCVCGSAAFDMATAAELANGVPFDCVTILRASGDPCSFASLLRSALKQVDGPSTRRTSKAVLRHGMSLPSSGVTPMHIVVRVFESSIAVEMLKMLFNSGANPNGLADVSLVRNWETSPAAVAAEAVVAPTEQQLKYSPQPLTKLQRNTDPSATGALLIPKCEEREGAELEEKRKQLLDIVAPILSIAVAYPHSQGTAQWLLSADAALSSPLAPYSTSAPRSFVDPCPPIADPTPLHIACSSNAAVETVRALLQNPRGREALARSYEVSPRSAASVSTNASGRKKILTSGVDDNGADLELRGSAFRIIGGGISGGNGRDNSTSLFPAAGTARVSGSCLHAAAATGDGSLVELLLEFAADDVNAGDRGIDGNGRKLGMVHGKWGVLLDTFARDSAGRSALHVASLCGHLNAAAALLDHAMEVKFEADMSRRTSSSQQRRAPRVTHSDMGPFRRDLATAADSIGKTPIKLAIDGAAPDIVRLFVEAHPGIAASIADRPRPKVLSMQDSDPPIDDSIYRDEGNNVGGAPYATTEEHFLDGDSAVSLEEGSAFTAYAAPPKRVGEERNVGLETKEQNGGPWPESSPGEAGLSEAELKRWESEHPLLYAERAQIEFFGAAYHPFKKIGDDVPSSSEALSKRRKSFTEDAGDGSVVGAAQSSFRSSRRSSTDNSDSSAGESDSEVSDSEAAGLKSPLNSARASAAGVAAAAEVALDESSGALQTTKKKKKRKSILTVGGVSKNGARKGKKKTKNKKKKPPVDHFAWRRSFRAEFALLTSARALRIDEIVRYLLRIASRSSPDELGTRLPPSLLDEEPAPSPSPSHSLESSTPVTTNVPTLDLPGLKDLPGLSDFGGDVVEQHSSVHSIDSWEASVADDRRSGEIKGHHPGGGNIEEGDELEDEEEIAAKKAATAAAGQAAAAVAKEATVEATRQVAAKWKSALQGIPHLAPCFGEGVTLLQKRWADLGTVAAILVQAAVRRFLGRCRHLTVTFFIY